MKAIRLRVEPFNFISIMEWDCVKELNEHSVLRVKGLISEKDRLAYYEHVASEMWVRGIGIDEDGEEAILFQGVLTNLTIHSQHEMHTMSVEVTTGTILLDQTLHTRSFQDSLLTYESVVNTCIDPEGGWAMMQNGGDTPINHMWLQYKETNWAFAKRLASRLGQPISPEYLTKGKRFYIGLNDQAKPAPMTSNNYSVSKSSWMGNLNTLENAQSSYQVMSREIYQLGQYVLFDNRKLVIGKITSRLQGEELWHEYSLFISAPVGNSAENPQLTGVSLRGEVTNVSRDRVQVTIHDDENKENAGHRWFDYATVYSTPDGMGWYCLPDEGDEVRLIFPEANETRAYVASSVHLSTEGGRHNPEHKSWSNKQNKEILFTPDTLLLRNNNGLLIELSDAEGIKIHSDKAIDIQSDKQIRINSQNANISLNAQDQISIQQKTARIHMKDGIDISGGKINMN